MPDKIKLNSSILLFAIYPKGGFLVEAVPFHTIVDNISGSKRPRVGDEIEKAAILHTWWRSLTDEEVKRMFGDGITLERIVEKLDVMQL